LPPYKYNYVITGINNVLFILVFTCVIRFMDLRTGFTTMGRKEVTVPGLCCNVATCQSSGDRALFVTKNTGS
jgi:hypothetical protein